MPWIQRLTIIEVLLACVVLGLWCGLSESRAATLVPAAESLRDRTDPDPYVTRVFTSVALDADLDGVSEYVFPGSTATSMDLTFDIDGNGGDAEFTIQRASLGRDILLGNCLVVGSVSATAAQICRDGAGDSARLYYDLDADKVKDAGEEYLDGVGTTDVDDITAGTLNHEYGGLEADVSGYSGIIGISGGATSEVDTLAELNTQVADATLVAQQTAHLEFTDGTDPSDPADTFSRLYSYASSGVQGLRVAFRRASNTIKSRVFASNYTLDLDLDGSPDFAIAEDWNGDGTLNAFTDIDAALNALTDSDSPVTLIVAPGDYGVPLLTDCDEAGEACFDRLSTAVGAGGLTIDAGLIWIHGKTNGVRLLGHGARIILWPYADDPGPATDPTSVHTITVSQSSDVLVEGFEIVGGGAAAYSTNVTGIGKRGVAVSESSDVQVIGNRCSYLHHACVFVVDSSDVIVQDNYSFQDGGKNDTQLQTQASYYFFTGGTAPNEYLQITGNTAVDGGGSAFNYRGEQASPNRLRRITAKRNTAIGPLDGSAPNVGFTCFAIRGVSSMVQQDQTCRGTGYGIVGTAAGTNYVRGVLSGSADPDSVESVQILGTVVQDPYPGAAGGITIGAWGTDVVVDGALVDNLGTDGFACAEIQLPNRGAVMRNLKVSRCGANGAGLSITGSGTTLGRPEEAVALENVTGRRLSSSIASSSSAMTGLSITTPVVLNAKNVDLSGATSRVVDVSGSGNISGSTFDGLTLDGTKPYLLGTATSANLTTTFPCNADRANHWVFVTSAATTDVCDGAAGSAFARCKCNAAGTAYEPFTYNARALFENRGVEPNNVTFRNATFKNIDNRGLTFLDGTAGPTFLTLANVTGRNDSVGIGRFALQGVIDLDEATTVRMNGLECNTSIAAGSCWTADAHTAFRPGSQLVTNACTGSCTDGVVCIDTDGGAGTTFYDCEGGSYAAR